MASSSKTVSRSRTDNIKRAAVIKSRGHIVDHRCDHCFSSDQDCVRMMTDKGLSKCASCTKRGRPCVVSSWESLERAQDQLSEKISADEQKREELIAALSEIQARIDRNRRIRDQAREREQEKLDCLMREMEANGDPLLMEDMAMVDFSMDSIGVESPFRWMEDNVVPPSGVDLLASAGTEGTVP